MNLSFRHVSTSLRVHAGEDSLSGLSKELERTGAERVVVVCGRSMVERHADVTARVVEAIGLRFRATFADAQEHSPVRSVEAAASLLSEVSADAVVALGGGTAVVTARAASILAAEKRPIRELSTRREGGRLVSPRLVAPKITQWVVPTTPTTAYAKAGAAVRDSENGERLALFDPKVRASGVFLHPDLAVTAPVRLVMSSALNAFAMCVDGLQAGPEDPLAEAQMRHALTMLHHDLPALGADVDGDLGVRLMVAALLAGQASDHLGTGLAQPISHAMGPLSNVGNGVIEAMMLPHVLTFNRGWTDARVPAILTALDPRNSTDPASAPAVVADFLQRLDVPSRLRDAGVQRDDLGSVIGHVVDDWSTTAVPRPANHADLEQLLAAAW